MKSPPVSVPPPLAETPNPDATIQELKRLYAEANGPSRTPSRLPKATRWSKRTKILVALAVALLVVGTVAGAAYILANKKDQRTDLILHKVKDDRLELNIIERGALESTNNHDIVCRVKARSQA